ncbi:unnamed protein product [Symbiodinium sp. CCMP2592]|nr:unnamed protein product [Symbiodinium sp. CCMP2592]
MPLHTRPGRRLRIVCWNSGGLNTVTYQEVLQWLKQEDQAGRSVDIMCVVETAWREDSEFTTRKDPNVPRDPQWHAVHTGTKEKAGVLCLIRATLVAADEIRYNVLQAGRLLHVRLQLQVPLDILCIYQIAWNPSRSTLDPSHKVEQLVQQRDKLWKKMSQWVAQVPLRHGFLMLGDFNTPLKQELPFCGPGLASAKDPPHKDRESFQALLRQAGGRALNTWSTSGCSARTFLPPTASADALGTQIDYIIVRDGMCDQEARKTKPTDAPFIPHSGCRHLLLCGTVPLPSPPRSRQSRPTRVIPNRVQRTLGDPRQVEALWQATAHLESGTHAPPPDLDLDAALAQSWALIARPSSQPQQATVFTTTAIETAATTQLVRQLWQIRDCLKSQARYVAQAQAEVFLVNMWHGWRHVCHLQKTQRELRRRGRQRKIAQVVAAVEADNVFQAAKQFAPKTRRRRLQLRTEQGTVQTHEEEFHTITAYFRKLYGGPAPSPNFLSEALHISPVEVSQAIRHLAPGKAMPSYSAPAAVWKALHSRIVPLITYQFAHVLQPGPLVLPRQWCISELVLLPKPGKALTSVDQLRPICLLAPMAKVLAVTLADRLRPFASRYLRNISQFAYLPQRSLSQALERVAAHCSEVKALLAAHSRNPYTSSRSAKLHCVEGGIMLSLDISKAYDCVSRSMLTDTLNDAAVPPALLEAILAIHDQACIRVTHHQCQQDVPLHTGLRQGCGLSPVLWAMVSGWLLKQLPGMDLEEKARCATAYADDFLYKWIIKSGRALEEAYSKIRQVLIHLSAHGLEISTSKTVILVELRGSKAQQALRKYTVTLKDGLYMRFQLGAKQVDLKIVPHHVYLGAVIGYRRMGPDTLKHRVALATDQFSRLRPILRCRAVPQQLRLRLWHACIPSCLLHGLDCTGLTSPEAMQVRSLIVQQARTVVNSHSMWTHETNQDFTRRLQIVQPLERLHQAILHRQRLDSAQLQWRAVLLSQVQLAEPGPSAEPMPAHVVPVHQIAEIFDCPECGLPEVDSCATPKMTLPPLSEEASTEEATKQRLLEATEELRMMESLAPKGSVGLPSALSQGALQEAPDVAMGRGPVDEAGRRAESDRPQKWLKPGATGSADLGKGQPPRPPAKASRQHSNKGGGKGKYRQAPWRQDTEQEEWYEEDQWTSNHRESQYIQYLKTRVDLLTTLLLRHDNQLSILRLDSTFMVFIRTDMEGSLAKALYDTGVTWKETKEKEPTKLDSPMRVVLCQALFTAVASRFEQMVNAEDSRTTAIQLGWLTADATKLNRMKWDHEAKKHVIDSDGTQLEVKKALSMIMELVVLCKEPLVVNRFHATRPMTKETEAATLPMLLDLGMRTPSADKAWGLLRDLCGSAIWLAAGVNVRPERLQRGPLPQKLAAMQAKSSWSGRS